jgi:WD40 repeat protein
MDARTGESRVLGRHKAEARTTEFSPDGAYLISGAWGGQLICWDAQTLQRAFDIELNSYIGQFRADGRAYAATTPSDVQLHAFERPSAYREFAEDLGIRLDRATFSPDGRWLAASADKRMGIWDLTAGGPGMLEQKAYDTSCAFTSDGRELFGSRHRQNGDNAVFRWRVTPATEVGGPPRLEPVPLRKPRGFTSLCLISNSIVMITTNGSQMLAPADIEAQSERWAPTISGYSHGSGNGRWLGIHRSYGTALYIYSLPGLEQVATLTRPTYFRTFHFSPLGNEVVITSDRTGLEFWSTTTWERTRALTNFIGLLYTPDARALWLNKDRRNAGLYDTETLEPLVLLPTGMLPLALSPDGQRLAVSVDAQRLQLWDLAALRQQFRELGLDWSTERFSGAGSGLSAEPR